MPRDDHSRSGQTFRSMPLGRRRLLKTLGAIGSALTFSGLCDAAQVIRARAGAAPSGQAAQSAAIGEIPKRPFGNTGIRLSILCFGGAHWGRIPDDQEAYRLLHEAIDAGVNFLDNAWEYNSGRSEVLMGKALAGRRHDVFLMTKVCSHGRDKRVAMQQLDESLRRLRTDHIDLWQIHEVIYDDDPARHFAQGGAAEALLEAKRQGKVRFIGFTGHKHPKIHLAMLAREFPFDACQLPLNVFDGSYRSFEQEVLPVLNQRGIAALGMKSLSGNAAAIKQGLVTPQEALRYALSLPVVSVVSGIDSEAVLTQNLDIARRFTPMTAVERQAVRDRLAPYAQDGRFELFKSSDHYDGRIGRQQHDLP